MGGSDCVGAGLVVDNVDLGKVAFSAGDIVSTLVHVAVNTRVFHKNTSITSDSCSMRLFAGAYNRWNIKSAPVHLLTKIKSKRGCKFVKIVSRLSLDDGSQIML